MDSRLTLNTFTATIEAAVCDQSCAFLCHLNFCQQFLKNLSTMRCNIDYKPIALYYIGTDWRRIPNPIHHSITLVVGLTIWIVPLVMRLHVNSCVKWIVCYVSKWMTSWRACLGGSVGWDTVRTCRNGLPEGRGSIPGSAGRFRVRISAAHALRLISRAGKEGSTVSSIICDRWLILS